MATTGSQAYRYIAENYRNKINTKIFDRGLWILFTGPPDLFLQEDSFKTALKFIAERRIILSRIVDICAEVLVVILMAVISVSVGIQVFFRYVLGSPLGWTEEISRYGLVWLTFIGIYVVFQRSNHMMITVLYDRFSVNVRKFFFLVGYLIMIIFFVYLALYGFRYSLIMMPFYPDILPIPIGLVYAAVPISSTLCLISCIQNFKKHYLAS